MKNSSAKAWHLAGALGALVRTFLSGAWKAFRAGHGSGYLRYAAYALGRPFGRSLRGFLDEALSLGDLFPPRFEKLRLRCEGLHRLLPPSSVEYGYSILIPVYQPDAAFLRAALRSALAQTAPRLEILVGLDGPQNSAVETAIDDFKRDFPKAKTVLRVFRFDKREGISQATNKLAREAREPFLLLMDHDDWMRPDLLYRYELTLRLEPAPLRTVLFCDEFKINERDEIIPGSLVRKPLVPAFPYVFQNLVTHCLLVPRQMFFSIGGLRSECDGAQDYDLCLRLAAENAAFRNVPLPLYAWRAHSQSTALNPRQKSRASDGGVKALQDYVHKLGLAWEVSEGLWPTTYRAKPRLDAVPSVQVVMPFRNQRELTLKAVRRVMASTGVKVAVTAIDNGSTDTGIGEALLHLGCEVLRVDEPFNYSRLNNRGVRDSRYREECGLVLFLNNDVDLEPDALEEMCRWVSQPGIGAVGARLHYPDGTLQHGGIDLDAESPRDRLTWVHTECGYPERLLARTLVLRACEAVTAACLLMKRQDFLDVGGFDEVYYPIAYSDTNLCWKIRRRGQSILYTPYAKGTHFESATRGRAEVEDFEASAWLAERSAERGRA